MSRLGRDKVDLSEPLDVGEHKPLYTLRHVSGREWEVLRDGVRIKLCDSQRDADDLYWSLVRDENKD